MPKKLRWKGTNIVRPGLYTYFNLDGLINVDLTSEATVLVIGEADAGQPFVTLASPIVHTFKSSRAMKDTFISGNLAEMANILFDPLVDGQDEWGVPLRGCDTVIAIKTNQSTQASKIVRVSEPAGNACFTVKDRLWGTLGNQTWFQIAVSGTGLKFVAGRDNEPNIGSQDSSTTGDLFSITGIDEWLSITTTAAYTGVSCVVSFDGTTLTINSSVAAEDLAVTCTNKTMTAIVSEINAFGGVTPPGTPPYAAVVLRSDRADTLATYMDIVSVPVTIHPIGTTMKMLGVSYDMVEWINTSCDYLEATWTAGYEPSGVAYVAKTYCGGAVVGDTTSTLVENALKVAARLGVRFVVSGYDGPTGGAVPVALSTINPLFSTHATNCNKMGSNRERQVFISIADTTFTAALVTALGFNNQWLNISADTIYREGPDDVKAWLGSHCVAAGKAAFLSSAPWATPELNKRIKCYDYASVINDAGDPFDITDDADFSNAQDAGIDFLGNDPDIGVHYAAGFTSYSAEDNDGKCQMESVNAQMWMRIVYRRYLQKKFGTKGAGSITTQAILDVINNANYVMAQPPPGNPDFLLVSGTDSSGNRIAAYSGFTCTLQNGAYFITGQVFLTSGVRFIFQDIIALQPSATA